MKVTIGYKADGTIVNSDTEMSAMTTGYFTTVEIPDGKVIVRMDTTQNPHLPVFVDEPKTPAEMSIESIKKTVPRLLEMDIKYAKRIDTLENQVAGFTADINQVKLQLENLQG